MSSLSIPRLIAFVILTSTLIAATRIGPASTSSYVQTACYSKYGSKSIRSIPTFTETFTRSTHIPVIINPVATRTVSPPPVTKQVTSTLYSTTVTTGPALSNTFTTIVTPSFTSVTTSTATLHVVIPIITTVSVTVTPTTVITTPAGFTPVASQITALQHSYARKRDLKEVKEKEPRRKRTSSIAVRADKDASKSCHGSDLKCFGKYPKQVQCMKVVQNYIYETYIAPATTSTTITATPSTVTKTTSSISTVTSTVAPPNVSLTVTSTADTITIASTETVTVTTTSGSVTTRTQTTTLPAPSVADPITCEANNMVTLVDGKSINAYITSGDFSGYNRITASSALQCCQMCQINALNDPSTCRFYFYIAGTMDCAMESSSGSPEPYTLYLASSAKYPSTFGNGGGGLVNQIRPQS